MLRDDHSDYKCLFDSEFTSADNAATTIIKWCVAFDVPNALMSDGSYHFRNDVERNVLRDLTVSHHLTLPYTPWSNGAVERLGKKLHPEFRAIISKLRLRPEDWKDLLLLMKSSLDNFPSP